MTTTVAPSRPAALRHRFDLDHYFVYVGFVLIFVVMAALLGNQGFLQPQNLLNILLQTAPVTLMAVATVFVLSTGEIDLSIGAVVALAALVSAVAVANFGLVAGIVGGLLTGVVVGLVNGVLITVLRLPSFLVTLGMLGLVTGLSQRVTNLQAVPSLDEYYNGLFGTGSLAGISSLIWWSALFVVGGHFLYRHTRIGAHVLATGDNERAARVSGIKVDRIKIGVLVASAVAAALAGMLYTGRLQGATYTLGAADLLTVIAAVVIGGTRLFGGKGSVIGALVGSLILGMLNNGLILAGLTDSEQQIARGLIILIAVALTLREKKQS
ncbi:ABC transporter permease [Pseudonocardia sp. MH-G8]|uniref:ABC transporter permease n=1 Tax=Pseudonocardia sp. MH-G8 TaxID=1854588 RepID=UPI000BA0569E|nr:ABC transporter permease [Pseudonocardia sp. MH-G8]OZM75464.1 ABC transporter permease [Pseudonocardia sp. MH-G8]